MRLTLDEEQRHIKETAQRILAELAPVGAFRKLRDSRDATGYSTRTWKELAALGFAGVTIPEGYGGLGMGLMALGGILEETGRRLYASPLIATFAGATVVDLAGTEQQRQRILKAVAAGELTLALAVDEDSRHDSARVSTTAVETSGGYRLNGRNSFVMDGHSADVLVVAAHQGSGTSIGDSALFLVDRVSRGVRCTRTRMVDSRNSAHIDFVDVQLDERARLRAAGPAQSVIDRALDRTRICLAAEMLGGTLELFERTIAYLKEREQFGVKIGTFQALRHRAAKIHVEIELTRSAVIAAESAADENSADVPLLASLCKARANETYRLVSNEAVQMHGGIGVTDALDIGLFLKRSRVSAQSFGSTHYLRDRYARLAGF